MKVLSLLPHVDLRGIRAPTAPKLCLAFARWNGVEGWPAPISLHSAGKGGSPHEAALTCLGEMAENLGIGTTEHRGPLEVISLSGDAAELSLRDTLSRDLTKRCDPGSEGAAAGETLDAALLAAASERLERAAVHDWWTGLRPAEEISKCLLREWGTLETVERLRAGAQHPRAERFYALIGPMTTVVCVSHSPERDDLAFGYAASLDPATAARRAFEEAVVQELPLLTARGKDPADQGVEERRAVARSRHVLEKFDTLFDAGANVWPSARGSFSDAVAELGVSSGYVDLTVPIVGVPVVRFLAPSLPSARPLAFRKGCPSPL